tara:strand:- start:70062 stop:70379 length:318 start_codon:yes stop_codon:yes gene_type:complete
MSKKIDEITEDYDQWLYGKLKNKRYALAYLEGALKEYEIDNNTEAFLLAFRDIAKAQGGIAELAKKTNLNRESLYKTLSSKGNPKLETLITLLKGLGFRFSLKLA